MTAPNRDGPTTTDVLAAVRAAIDAVYRDTARPPRDVAPGALLGADLGLDSLDLAQIVVLLERSLGVDPFRDPAGGGQGGQLERGTRNGLASVAGRPQSGGPRTGLGRL